MENVFVTNPNKPHVAGYFALGEMPWTIIKYLVEKYTPKTVLDVGCGPFASKKLFRSFGVGLVWCLDGDDQLLYRDDLKDELNTFCVVDLERSYYRFPCKFDMVFSYECAEHIMAADNYINTITMNCDRILAITHALPGSGGHHHVNEQEDDYWIKRITEKGFKYLENESLEARGLGDGYFSRSGLIFQRVIQ